MARAPGEIAQHMRRLRTAGLIVSLVAVGVAAGVASFVQPTPVQPLQGHDREAVMHVLADDEPIRRVGAIRAFPADRWSQGDAFHGRESEIVRAQTAAHNVALESVLDVLDEDLHARRVPGRVGGVAPCKPRPQYD